MKSSVFLIVLSLFVGLKDLSSQDNIEYIPPMDIPLVLSGNFGEMRRNHFHTGIDIKTQGRQGIPLLSIADGYISRIKVSPYGYGNALYIDHPDGRTSVYAHMRSFNDSIASYIKSKQYEEETWAIEYYPDRNELMVSQGELIGLSGNTGSSSGPHLHFEVRDTKTEHPINPLTLGFHISDDKAPLIKGLRTYPLNQNSHVSSGSEAASYVAKAIGDDTYEIRDAIHVNGNIGLGIHCYDLMTATNNKYGVYHLEMLVNGVRQYSHVMNELDFDNFRQVNCHKDYDLFHTQKWRYHKCFLAENNSLAIYDELVGNGSLWIATKDTLKLTFIASDVMGNSSTLTATLIGAEELLAPWPTPAGILMEAGKDNLYLDTGLVVRIPHGRIYDDFYFNPQKTKLANAYSDAYQLHDKELPLDAKISVSIQGRNDAKSHEHMVMEHTDFKGRKKYLQADQNEDWFESEQKFFGTYRLVVDNSPPHVKVTGLEAKSRTVELVLGDNRSGVLSFTVSIDGQWLLMAHNASMNKAWGDLSDIDLSSGKHVFKVEVTDVAGNKTVEEIEFTY